MLGWCCPRCKIMVYVCMYCTTFVMFLRQNGILACVYFSDVRLCCLLFSSRLLLGWLQTTTDDLLLLNFLTILLLHKWVNLAKFDTKQLVKDTTISCHTARPPKESSSHWFSLYIHHTITHQPYPPWCDPSYLWNVQHQGLGFAHPRALMVGPYTYYICPVVV